MAQNEKFVTGLPDRVPAERHPPSIEESLNRVRAASKLRRYGNYRGPKRTALERAGIDQATKRMLGEDD